jgi:hypothetical protein
MTIKINKITGIGGNPPTHITVEGTVTDCDRVYGTVICSDEGVKFYDTPTGGRWSLSFRNDRGCACGEPVEASASCLSNMAEATNRTEKLICEPPPPPECCDKVAITVDTKPLPCIPTGGGTISVQFSASLSPKGCTGSFEWSVTDLATGSIIRPFAPGGSTFSYSYAGAGTYRVDVRVKQASPCEPAVLTDSVNVTIVACAPCTGGGFLDGCHIDLPPDDVVEEIEFERFFLLNHSFGEIQDLDSGKAEPTPANGANVPAGPLEELRSYDVALYFPYTQQWKLKGYTRGRLVKSFSLGPGEEQTVELFTWDRLRSSFESTTSFDSEQTTENTGSRRDTLDVARETTRKLGFEMTTSGKVQFQAGIFHVDLNQGLSASGAVSEGEKATRNSIAEATSKSSNKVRTSRALKVTESRESGSEERVTRKLRNPNTCHTLNVPFFEVLANYLVATFLRTENVRLVVLIKSEFLLDLPDIDREAVRIYETALRLALLDREVEPGFAAARLLDARDRACTILCKGCDCEAASTPTDSVEWIEMVKDLKNLADPIDKLRARQTFFPLSIPSAEVGLSDGTTDIKRHLFNRSLAKNAPRLLIDLAGIGFVKATEPSVAQVMALHRVLTALADDALAKLRFDKDVTDQVWADIRAFIFGDPLLPKADPVSAGISWGIASIRADGVKGKADGLVVYDDEGLVSKLLTFNRSYDAWIKIQQEAQKQDAELAKAAKIAKEEREARILESFGLRETADAEERLQALLAHLKKHKDHYRFAIWTQLSGATDSKVMDLARDGAIDPTPVGIVGDRLAVPLRLYPNTKLKTFFDESTRSLTELIERDERCHILPTAALYSEAILGECCACEDYVEQSRNLDLRQRAALAAQAEHEAERYAARLNATPPMLDTPNPAADAVNVRLETASSKP